MPRPALFALAALVLLPAAVMAAKVHRPNVLWIVADDLAPYTVGAYGCTRVKTPNIDRLAAEGLRFDRAYCNSPVCTASRAAFVTGRYPRTVGVTRLKTPLPEGEATLATLLKRAAYDTASFGKMHFNSALKHGFDLRLDLAEQQAYLKDNGKQLLPAGVVVQPPWRPFKDPARVWLNSDCRPFGAVDEDMAGTFFARRAAAYLADTRPRPFFLMVSFYEPHSPFHFPVEYRGRHRPDEYPVPRVGLEDDGQIPAIFRDLSDKEKQGIIAAYHTSVEFLDRNVGLVLDALKASGRDRDTIVVFIGDHGYMLGQHGRFEKHCCYEPAVRAPLIVRWPGHVKPRRVTAALVEFIDIVPTLLEACHEPVPGTVQGRSLAGLLRGHRETQRDHVIAEYSENEEAMIRTDRWKLIYSTGKRLREDGYATGRPLPGRTVLLFDEANDPDEMTNLVKQPEHAGRVEELTAKLADHMRRTARQPHLVPKGGDVHAVLEHCLQPRDVEAGGGPSPPRGK
jgi:choline-sulfatase